MRVALVGFSSPVAYDYKHEAERAPADSMSSPNPILFGATPIMLLFDEIWFVTKSLCPMSMRKLKFVRFLDEDGGLSADDLASAKEISGGSSHSLDLEFTSKGSFAQIETQFLRANNFGYDNHTHGLKVLGHRVIGNAGSASNLALDLQLKSILRDPDIDLIYNPFWSEDVDKEVKSLAQIGVTNELVLRRIPNPFNERGPKVDDIEKWRENKFIGDFRSWVASQDFPKSLDKIKDTTERIEKDIFGAMRKAYLRELNKFRMYKSLSKSVAGELAGHVVPGASLILDLSKELREEAKIRPERWRAFLLSLDEAQDTEDKVAVY